MTVEEARKLKHTTEQNITYLLNKFREETGLSVDSIDLCRHDAVGSFKVLLRVSL